MVLYLINLLPYTESQSLCNFVVIVGFTNSTDYVDANSPDVCYLYANSTPVAPGVNISIDCKEKKNW